MNEVALVYVDTSALGALLVEQPETGTLVEWLDNSRARLVSSDLLETELRRMADLCRREADRQADRAARAIALWPRLGGCAGLLLAILLW